MIINGIFSIVGFIKKNNDLLLISICLSAIIFILCLIFSSTFGMIEVILLLISFLVLLIGFILENRK